MELSVKLPRFKAGFYTDMDGRRLLNYSSRRGKTKRLGPGCWFRAEDGVHRRLIHSMYTSRHPVNYHPRKS